MQLVCLFRKKTFSFLIKGTLTWNGTKIVSYKLDLYKTFVPNNKLIQYKAIDLIGQLNYKTHVALGKI